MLKNISKFILKAFGWKIIANITPEIKKSVLIVAPHTSNWDFVIRRMVYFALNVNVKFLIKKEFFRFPLDQILKKLGGIPVKRDSANLVVNHIVNILKKNDSLIITITPEGTRKYNAHWKKGFYHIAQSAKVPIVLGYLDYKKKEAGIGHVIYTSGNFDKDFKFIEDFYRDKTAKYPDKFNLTKRENRY